MARKKKNVEVSAEAAEIMQEAEEIIQEAADTMEETADLQASESDSAEELNPESDVYTEESLFLTEGNEESEGLLPEASENDIEEVLQADEVSLEGTELDNFESAEIEDIEFVEEERLESILEGVLFASDRPVSLNSLKMLFKGTNIRGDKIRKALDQLAVEYAGGRRGVTLEEVPGGYQLRTKIDNMDFLKRTLKTRPFKLSGPALEVMAIVAYKQPLIKSDIDEIRGVESGHLLRALMEKNLVTFEGKSDLPGRPMQYGTTKKFLEIFGLRNLKELPTLSQIDELLPEGIDENEAVEKPTLASITDSMSENILGSYSQGEEELVKIQNQLEEISTSSDFFAEEKTRQAEKRDSERAQNIREALTMGEPVATRDQNWLLKYDEALAAGTTLVKIKNQEAQNKIQALKESKLAEGVDFVEEASSEEAAAETVVEEVGPDALAASDLGESLDNEGLTFEEEVAEHEEDANDIADVEV